ncbi:hypothetical protein [Chlamydia ibidis]|nr:hypothetical protein [Chlamydia ibidis]
MSYPSTISTTTSLSSKLKIGSDAWIESKLRQYPELLWLTEPTPLSNTLENPLGSVFSPALFGKQLPALDIALRSMVTLHLFIQGSRQAYTQLSQLYTTDDRLTFKQFQSVHRQLIHFLNSAKQFDDMLKILETAIVLRHIGCSVKAAATFKPYFSESHLDGFYTKAMHVLRTFPDLSPSFSRLSPEQKEVFFSLRRMANYNMLMNLSSMPTTQLLSVGRSKRSLIVLDLYLYSLDMCGTQSCSQEFYHNFSPLLAMLQQHATVEEAFSRYFTYRANRLGLEGVSRTDMTLVRLATLMQLPSNEVANLTSSFKGLPLEEAETLINTFCTPQGELISLEIRGLPNLISAISQANLVSGTATLESRARQIYSTTLGLIVKGLRTQKEMLQKQLLPQGTVLDFSETAVSCGGLDLSSENIAVRIHLNGSVSITF